jgi:hypothetical protein
MHGQTHIRFLKFIKDNFELLEAPRTLFQPSMFSVDAGTLMSRNPLQNTAEPVTHCDRKFQHMELGYSALTCAGIYQRRKFRRFSLSFVYTCVDSHIVGDPYARFVRLCSTPDCIPFPSSEIPHATVNFGPTTTTTTTQSKFVFRYRLSPYSVHSPYSPTDALNTIQYNTMQHNTIQYNTV